MRDVTFALYTDHGDHTYSAQKLLVVVGKMCSRQPEVDARSDYSHYRIER